MPPGRWCNRCGALLPAGRARPDRSPAVAVAVVAAVLVVGALGVVLTTASSARSPTAAPVRDPAVVLAEDAPAPTVRATPAPRDTPVPMVDVICSDLQRRSVPAALVGSVEPGALADLSWGPCVVMGPEGVAVP